MHTHFVRRIAKLPVIREVLGASVGGALALVLYAVFELARSVTSLGLLLPLMLAGACAFVHRRMISLTD